MRRGRWATVAVVAVLALAGCETEPVPSATPAREPGGPTAAGVERFDPLTSRVRVPEVAGLHRTEHATSAVIVFEHADGFIVETTGPGGADPMTRAGAVTVVDGAADEAHWTGNYLLS